MILGLYAYGLAAASFAGLALLCATSWHGGSAGRHLAVACGLTAVWAGLSASWAHGQSLPLILLLGSEVARDAAWLMFLARLIPGDGWGSARGLARLTVVAGAVLALAGGLLAAGEPRRGMALIPAGLGAAVFGLVLLEQVFRNSRPERREAAKLLLVGVGGLFAYDLFLYSHAFLFRGVDADLWVARGFANALAVPVLAIAVRRNPDLSVNLFVSRHVTFYTAALIGVGVYLVAMALAGYGIRLYGGRWGVTLQAVFLSAAIVVLASLLLSGSLRSRARVFIAKHFYANRYDYREEWLRLTATLSDEAEPLGRRAVRALAQTVEAGGGTLWERRAGPDGAPRWERTAALETDGPAILEAGDPLVAFIRDRLWSIQARDVGAHPERYEGLRLPDWLPAFGPDALAVPVVSDEELYGLVVLRDPRPGLDLDYEDIDLLRVAGRQVAAVLAQAEADRQLTEARQFEAFNRLTTFLMHDLKNLIAQQSMVVRNAVKHRHDPAFFDDVIETIDNSVQRMQRLLAQLSQGTGRERSDLIDLNPVLAAVVAAHADRPPAPQFSGAPRQLRVRVEPDRLAMVVGHLVRNAQDATPADGTVRVEASEQGGWAVLAVTDTGSGMEEEFVRDRLFRPFDSTKGAKGMGIGAYQARQCAEEAGGSVRVESRPGAGTRFEIRLPLADAGSGASVLSGQAGQGKQAGPESRSAPPRGVADDAAGPGAQEDVANG